MAIAAAYYYVSVPIVIVAVVGLAGAIVYGFMMIGWLPIKLLLIVGIVALVSVWSMLRSLIVRRGPDEDPGGRWRRRRRPRCGRCCARWRSGSGRARSTPST